jgi:hypothetical protein
MGGKLEKKLKQLNSSDISEKETNGSIVSGTY